MVEPTYVRVRESRKGVRVALTRCSKHAHIVRAWGVFRPDKLSNIQEIDRVELRTGPAAEAVAALIPPHNCPFWIAVEVFCNTGGAWRRSIPRLSPEAVPCSFVFEDDNVGLDIDYT